MWTNVNVVAAAELRARLAGHLDDLGVIEEVEREIDRVDADVDERAAAGDGSDVNHDPRPGTPRRRT